MSQEAYLKHAPESTDDTMVIIDEDLVKTGDRAYRGQLFSIPCPRIAESLGKRIMANIVMLGFFAAVTNVVSPGAIRQAVEASVPKGTEQVNLAAFDQGFSYGREMVEGSKAAE